MSTTCENCGDPLPEGGVIDGEPLTHCGRCEPTLVSRVGERGQPVPTLDPGRPPKTGQLFPRSQRTAFPHKPHRVTLPQIGRAPIPGLYDADAPPADEPLDRTAESPITEPDDSPVDRRAVAEALSRLDNQLGPDWTELLATDALPTLLVQLERVRRIMPGPALDEATRRLLAWQKRRVGELLGEFQIRIKADELDQADALLGQVRRISDDIERLDRATAVLARAWDDRHATEEGRLKLDRARELSAPPHPPRKLKQALKLYDDLLRRLDRYVGLRSSYDLIKSERDEVERLVKAGDRQESQRATAIAIGRIDVLVSTLEDYTTAKASGRLEEDYAQSRIEEIEREIGDKLAGKVDEYLQDADEIARNPRDARVALDRLREHERLWHYLPTPQRVRVERRAETLAALVQRRDDVIARCEAASASIGQGDYVAAIRQLCVQRDLHTELQIDVSRPLDVAVSALEQRIERRLDEQAAVLEDPYVTDADLGRLMSEMAEIRAQLDPVASHVESLAANQARAGVLEREARRLRGELARCDREIERVRDLLDAGQAARARRVLERLDRAMPPQRKADLADLKEDLDLVVREDEIESRLHVLALSDPEAALAWADRHPENRACQQYRLHMHSASLLDEIRAAESDGEYERALLLATRLAHDPPPPLAEHVEGIVRHLERVIRDRSEVRRRLDALREARRTNRLVDALGLFEGELAVPADLAGEWQLLRDEAQRADAARLRDEVEAALAEARRGREAWQSAGWPADDVLATPDTSASFEDARGHIDDALRALESAASAAAALGRRRRSSTVETTLHTVEIEQRVCRAEAAIGAHDFESAHTVLGEPIEGEDPRIARVRARLRRLAFGRRFGHAIATGKLDAAREAIDAYGARAADETLRAERIHDVAAHIDEQVETAQTRPARDALDGLTEAHHRHAELIQSHPPAAAALAALRTRLDDAIVRAVDAFAVEAEQQPLPGPVIECHRVVGRLIGDDGMWDARLHRRQAEFERDMVRSARADLDTLEGESDLEIFSIDQMHEIERRLDHLARFLPDDDPQLDRCRRRIRQHRTTRTRRRDAERRRDALVRAAAEALDVSALNEACELEQDGIVDGDVARQMLARWRRAEPVVIALGEAMSARAFDRVAHLLDQLEQTESEPHIARLVLDDPFDPTQSLPAGVARIREDLPLLVARDHAVHARRAQELSTVDALVSEFQAAICLVAADAPPGLDADAGYGAYLQAAARWASEQSDILTRRLHAAADTDPDGRAAIRRIEARLPPTDAAELRQHLDERFRAYRTDHRFAMSCSQAPLQSLRQHRDQLQAIRERWTALPDFLRLIDELLR